MVLKQFTTDFKNIGEQEFLRLNFGYRYFFDIQKANVFQTKNNIKLRWFLELTETKKVLKGELEEPEILVDIGNIERRFNNLINCEKTNEIGSDKNVLQNGDIIIPKMQPRMGNIFLNIEHKRYIGSTELLEYKIASKNNYYFIYYLFTTKKFLSDLAKLESGKTHRRVNPVDLLKIKIPNVPRLIQDQIIAEIKLIENKVREMKRTIQQPQEIINKVFAKVFSVDLEKFENLKKEKFWEAGFGYVSKNNFVRLSTRFHHKNLKFIEDQIKDKNIWISVNSLFELFGGTRIPKGKTFSNDETDYFYLRPTEVNIWGIDKKNVPHISTEIYNQLKKYKIVSGELCISIEGTLGKIALINTDDLEINKESLILSKNFIKLIPRQKINHLFYYYYFYSFIFEAQLDREHTITTIKTLANDKWNYIKVPNVLLVDQQKIVDEIKSKFDKQEEAKRKIEEERDKIDEIISNSWKNGQYFK